MAERSFKAEVEHLRKGDGDTFTGEGSLALTKALLENGVGYVGGYQGAPISHLMDVLADAEDLMAELGIRFEANANEAARTMATTRFTRTRIFSSFRNGSFMRSKVIDERPTCRGATEEIPGDVVKCSDAEERHGTERSRSEGVDPGEAGRNPGRG